MCVRQVRPARDVHDGADERLVQRNERVAIAPDAGPIAQRLLDGQAEGDAGVLDRVVAIDVEVALGLDGEVQQRVPRERVEHVVEEPDPGLHRRVTAAVQVHPDVQVGLLGGAADLTSAAHGHPRFGRRTVGGEREAVSGSIDGHFSPLSLTAHLLPLTSDPYVNRPLTSHSSPLTPRL